MLLAHIDKNAAAIGGKALGFSGSTGWHNSVRGRLYLYPPEDVDPDERRAILEVKKLNNGKPCPPIHVRFDDIAGTFVQTEAPKAVEFPADDLDALVAMIVAAEDEGEPIPAASGGTSTAYSVAKVRDDFPAACNR